MIRGFLIYEIHWRITRVDELRMALATHFYFEASKCHVIKASHQNCAMRPSLYLWSLNRLFSGKPSLLIGTLSSMPA
jgi:hypothetical protein